MIVLLTLRDRKKRTLTYNQLVLGISSFDMISSLAFLFEFALLPAGSSLPHARGNEQTCMLQAVMIQMGFTSVYFNLLLAIYFWLTVAKGWKENQFKRVRVPVYAVTIFLQLALSVTGIPLDLYGPMLHVCSVRSPPLTDTWLPTIIFVLVPICVCLLGIALATAALFASVYKLERASAKWRLAKRAGGNSMTGKVFWRCFWFLLAFYVSYPLVLSSYLVKFEAKNYAFWVAFTICSPLQGFLNFLVYYQRSIYKTFKWPRTSNAFSMFSTRISNGCRKSNAVAEPAGVVSHQEKQVQNEDAPAESSIGTRISRPSSINSNAPKHSQPGIKLPSSSSSSSPINSNVSATPIPSLDPSNLRGRLNSIVYYEQSISSRSNLMRDARNDQGGSARSLVVITERVTEVEQSANDEASEIEVTAVIDDSEIELGVGLPIQASSFVADEEAERDGYLTMHDEIENRNGNVQCQTEESMISAPLRTDMTGQVHSDS